MFQFVAWARYFQFSKRPILLPIEWGVGTVSPWVKHLGCETHCSSPSCVKIKEPVALHLYSSICFHDICKDNFNFTVIQTQAKQTVAFQKGYAATKSIRTHCRCILYEWMEWEWPASHEQFLDHIPKWMNPGHTHTPCFSDAIVLLCTPKTLKCYLPIFLY